VASEVGGIPEIIPDAEYGLLVPAGNVVELEKSLKYLITKDQYRNLIGDNIQKRIKTDFSFKETLKETLNLYQK
jgi:glycosyltransferase involved in cell wall biosynthesis